MPRAGSPSAGTAEPAQPAEDPWHCRRNQSQHSGFATSAPLDSGISLNGRLPEEADVTGGAAGEGPDTMGGPEPDEEGTDVMGGSRPGTDEMGGPEPNEEGTDVMGGSRPGTDEMGGPEPNEEGTDLMGGPRN